MAVCNWMDAENLLKTDYSMSMGSSILYRQRVEQ